MVTVTLFDGHEFDFPVWVMVDSARFLEVGLDAYTGFTDIRLGMVFGFFTDEDLAQQYIEDKACNNLRPQPIEDLVSFRELVEVANDGGLIHVTLDPTDAGNLKSKVYRLDEFLEALRKAGEEEG